MDTSSPSPQRRDNTEWSEVRLPGKLPERRSNHCSFIVNDYLYVHGGRDIKEGPMGNMWRLSVSGVHELINDPEYGVSWESIKCSGTEPGNISHHKPAVFGHSVVLFGGIVNSDQNTINTYEFDSNKNCWSVMKQTGAVPLARDDHAMCQLSDNSFLIFGGFVEGSRTNECYIAKKSGTTLDWTECAKASPDMPCIRASHSIAYNAATDKCYVFGGQDDDNNKLCDIWELDMKTECFKELSVPSDCFQPLPRSGQTANVFNNRMYIFGGILELTKEINEMLTFDFETCKFEMVEGYTQEELERRKQRNQEEENTMKRKLTMKKDNTNVSAIQKNLSQTQDQKKKDNAKLTAKARRAALTNTTEKEDKEEKKESGLATPTSISMQNTFIITNADESFDNYFHMMKKRKFGQGHSLDGTMPQSATMPQSQESNFGCVSGIQPDSREGHSCDISEDGLMFVFGGDRHTMAFNDLHMINLSMN